VENTKPNCDNRLMQQVKALIKKLLPKEVRQPMLNIYHLLVAVAANIKYGFPTRNMRVIMVTGTNGKTTTAAIIAKMLMHAGHKVGALTTAFYAFGDGKLEPNTSNRTVDDIFKIQALFARMKAAGCEYIVVEVTSQALDQHRVWGVPVDVAVMTNLTQDHLDYHGTMDRYAEAKGKLFAKRPKLIVLNRDDEWFDFFNQYPAEDRRVTYGTYEDSTCRIAKVDLHKEGSNVELVFENEHELNLHVALPGKFNVYNATAAAAVGYYLMLEPQQITDGIAALESVPGRLERVEEGQKFEVIVDYAHTPDALQNVLETLKHLTKGKLWVVFGATGNRDKSKRPIMAEVAAKLADNIVLTDDEPYDEDPAELRAVMMGAIKKADTGVHVQEIAGRREAFKVAFKGAKPGDIVALTGMGHEQFMTIAGEKVPWNDSQVAREILKSIR
jgi:UDP-N-acetylmuramoyl-L-alanyl-D-glutamate--2,6-diaminopimelate ligase